MRQLSASVLHNLALSLLAVLLVGFGASPAAAQSEKSHWAVTASFTPQWKIAGFVKDALSEDGDEVNMEGSQFSIGIGRGSTRGGDWNIAFVRKPFTDGVLVTSTDSNCFQPSPNQPQLCDNTTEVNSASGVFAQGVEASWFLSFVRIKDRVQAGLGVGVGFATMNGDIHKVTTGNEYRFVPAPGPGGGSFQSFPVHEEEINPAEDELLPFLPLFNLEAEGAVIITPALKLKVAGGLTFPGTGFRVGLTYLIGAK